jgi:hypothetical protein
MGGSLVGVVLLSSIASAASANISRAYQANGSIPNGSLVSFDSDKKNYVVPANTQNASRLFGVAVSADDSLLAVDAGSGAVQVATSGTTTTLVSDVGGTIKVGDQVGVSPFSGIGMKATSGSRIIGVAQTAFSATSDGSAHQQVADKSGKQQTITTGYIRVSIGVGVSTADTENLNALQRVAKSLTGKTISTVRIIIALIISLIALVALGSLVYSAIFGSIISVGRNPLAKHAIFRTLGGVIVIAIIMAGVAGVAVIFLLQ